MLAPQKKDQNTPLIGYQNFLNKYLLNKDHAANILKSKKILDQQILDLNVRIEQAEANASKSAKRNIQKLEQHVIFFFFK